MKAPNVIRVHRDLQDILEGRKRYARQSLLCRFLDKPVCFECAVEIMDAIQAYIKHIREDWIIRGHKDLYGSATVTSEPDCALCGQPFTLETNAKESN